MAEENAKKLFSKLCKKPNASEKIENLLKNAVGSLYWEDERGETVLHIAVMMGMSVGFDKLLDNLITYEEPDVVNKYNNLGYTPLHLAAEENKHDFVKLLLEKHADVTMVTRNGNSKETALHLATRSKALECMKLLVTNPKIDINAVNDLEETALHIAVASKSPNSLDCVQLLLENKCDVNRRDKNSFTVLHMAAVTGSAEIIQRLFDHKANPRETTIRKWTPLHLAAYKNNHSVISTLLMKERNQHNAINDCGQTALHLAAKIKHDLTDTVKQLIQHDKKTLKQNYKSKMIDRKDNDGRTALHIALEHKNIRCIQELVNNGADVGIKDNDDWTPLHYAAMKDYPDAIPKLIQKYDDDDEINACDQKNGFTPLHLAAQKGCFRFIQEILEKSPSSNVNTQDIEHRTPLYLAISHKQRGCVEALLNGENVDVNALTVHNMSAVHEAVLVNNIDGLKLLLKNRADVNTQAKGGWTPLHIAALKNHPKCINMLLKNGAVPTTQLDCDFTALDLAKQYNHADCIRLLEKHDNEALPESGPSSLPQKFISLSNKKAYLWQELGSQVLKGLSFNKIDSGKKLMEEQDPSPSDCGQPQDTQDMNCSIRLENPNFVDEEEDTGLHKEARYGHADHVKQILKLHSDLDFLIRKNCSNKTALHLAAECGHVDVVEVLLNACGNANSVIESKDDTNSTALHLAAQGGHHRCITKLLDAAAASNSRQVINFQNENNHTAFHLALQYNHTDCVKILGDNANINLSSIYKDKLVDIAINKGNYICLEYMLEKVKLDDEKCLLELLKLAIENGKHECAQLLMANKVFSSNMKENIKTSLDVASEHVECILLLLKVLPNETLSMFLGAAKAGNVILLKALLLENAKLINEKDEKKLTALHRACRSGELECVKILLEKNASVVERDRNGLTALHYSAKAGQLGSLEILLKQEATRTISHTKDDHEFTVLHHAAKKGHTDCLKALLRESNIKSIVDVKDSAGLTAVHHASREGHAECLQTLLDCDADVNCLDEKNATPVHMAAREDRVECLKILVKHKADMKIRTQEGWTALHYSAKNGHNVSVEMLLRAGVDSNGKTAKNFTPLRFAAANDHIECVKALLSCDGIKVNMKCDKNMTALHVAAWNNNAEIVELLLEKDADPSLKDEYNCLPLHRAVMKDSHLAMEKLLKWEGSKSLIDAKDVNGNTALWMAAKRKHCKSLELLINSGASVNVQSEEESKNTPLHEVVGVDNRECTNLLVNANANLKLKNAAGLTPVELAKQRGFKELRTMLEAAAKKLKKK